MSANADAMIADVVAHPDDDAPRLVYADWLLEQADPSERERGEFIHLSCELAKLEGAGASVRAPRVRRAMELLGRWELKWVDLLLDPLGITARRRLADGREVDWTWSRGFIERHHSAVARRPESRAGELDEVMRRTPLRDLKIALTGTIQAKSFLSRTWLPSLRALSVDFRLPTESIEQFFSTRALHQLKHLSMGLSDQRQLQVLSRHASAFTKLDSFEVRFVEEAVDPETVNVLAGLAFGGRLRHFGYTTATGTERLLELPFPIESLTAQGPFAGEVIRQLAAQPHAFPAMRRLEVGAADAYTLSWRFEELEELVSTRDFRALKLTRPRSAGGFERMIQHRELQKLEVLAVRGALRFGDPEVEALAAATHLRALRDVELSGAKITNRGAKAIASAPHLKRLRRLSLRNNHRIGADTFAKVTGLDELELLDLRGNSISETSSATEQLKKRFGAAVHVAFDMAAQ